MKNLVFGKYIPIDSFMHRLDPRAKLVALFIMIVAIFLPRSYYAFIVAGIVIFVSLLLGKIGIKMISQSIKPMLFMMFFLLFVNTLSIKTGTLLLDLGNIQIYSGALSNTAFVIVRLLLMISLTTILTATTKPLDLTLAIEWILKPFEKLKMPTHEIAMMVSIALRFIPTIIEETMRIMDAQKSRGVDFENGKLSQKIVAILSLIVPLFSVAFERAYELADAMEARGYVPGVKRTRYHVLKFKAVDFVYLFVCLLTLAFSIFTKIYL